MIKVEAPQMNSVAVRSTPRNTIFPVPPWYIRIFSVITSRAPVSLFICSPLIPVVHVLCRGVGRQCWPGLVAAGRGGGGCRGAAGIGFEGVYLPRAGLADLKRMCILLILIFWRCRGEWRRKAAPGCAARHSDEKQAEGFIVKTDTPLPKNPPSPIGRA